MSKILSTKKNTLIYNDEEYTKSLLKLHSTRFLQVPKEFNPNQINDSTILWFDSEFGVSLSGTTVTSWTDRVAGLVLDQQGSFNLPVYNEFTENSRRGLTFDHKVLSNDNVSILPSGNSKRFVCLVLSHVREPSDASGIVFQYGNPSIERFGTFQERSGTDNWTISTFTTRISSINAKQDPLQIVFLGIDDSEQGWIIVDNLDSYSTDFSGLSTAEGALGLGSPTTFNGSNFGNFVIYEAIVWADFLNETQRTALYEELKKRYAIT